MHGNSELHISGDKKLKIQEYISESLFVAVDKSKLKVTYMHNKNLEILNRLLSMVGG